MTEYVDHISSDGWIAICGESLLTDEPSDRPLCPGCIAAGGRPSRLPWWRRALLRLARVGL